MRNMTIKERGDWLFLIHTLESKELTGEEKKELRRIKRKYLLE